jgi:tRNA G46 methylase TrmB
LYLRINLEIDMRKGEMLQAMAEENYAEYFIGIGKDQNEVFKAKSRFAELDPQNASAFWGDTEKLLPAITDRSIDNFLMVLPEHSAPLATMEAKAVFRSMLGSISKKLVQGGAFRILTDLEKDSMVFGELALIASQAGFQLIGNPGKAYFPRDWRDPEFKAGRRPQVIVLAPK